MATLALTAATFEATVTANEIVLVDFWAAWCGPCRQFAPIYEEASRRHPDVVFGKVDTEAEQELAAAANITSIPTVMAFRDGLCVYSAPGSMPAAGIDEILDAVAALDMDEVRSRIAATQPGAPDDGPSGADSDPGTVRPAGGRAGVDYPDENGAIV